jgi:hypothetical protein
MGKKSSNSNPTFYSIVFVPHVSNAGMEKRVTVLYEQGLAQYDIQEIKNGHFIARLFRYNGDRRDAPPQEINMHKEGRHWEDGGAKQDLIDDIGLAIEYEKKAPDQPILHQRGNDQSREEERRTQGGKP